MSVLISLWHSAKLGTTFWLGPVTLHLRLARSVAVSGNRLRMRAPWRRAAIAVAAAPAAPAAQPRPLTPEPGRDGPPGTVSAPARPQLALIVGTGPGLGSALARRFAKAGMQVAVVARNTEKLHLLLKEIHDSGGKAQAFACDATDERSVIRLLALVSEDMGVPDVVVYNVEHFIPGTILDITTSAFEECWRAMTLGGFLVGRACALRMVARGSGTIIYTGATGALRGRADYINMAVGKFGLRALAQSMARDLAPQGIHVAHVILDGGILGARSKDVERERMSSMFPEHIAETYLQIHLQHRSVWTQEMDLRPWLEKF